MLRLLDDVKVAFFVEEEVGCCGSTAADLKFFDNAIFILQADRKDSQDFITHTNGTTVSSAEFQAVIGDLLKDYNFNLSPNGSSTDVGKLVTRGVGISCANVSSGYYGAHSTEEKVCISDLENTMNFFFHIATNKEVLEKRWLYVPEPPKTYTSSYNAYNRTTNKPAETGGSETSMAYFCSDCNDINCLVCPHARDNQFYM